MQPENNFKLHNFVQIKEMQDDEVDDVSFRGQQLVGGTQQLRKVFRNWYWKKKKKKKTFNGKFCFSFYDLVLKGSVHCLNWKNGWKIFFTKFHVSMTFAGRHYLLFIGGGD